MSLYYDQLTTKEHAIIKGCLLAASSVKFFPDWEFETLFPFSKDNLKTMSDHFSSKSCTEDDEENVICILGQLLGYPHGMDDKWFEYCDSSLDDVMVLLRKICNIRRGTGDLKRSTSESLLLSKASSIKSQFQ